MANKNLKNARKALRWIVDIFNKQKIKFQITGSLAAKIYGSKRPLNDIDIDIAESDFSKILPAVKKYLIYGPERFISEIWDCQMITLNYQRQKIDISGAETTRIFDKRTKQWQKCPANLKRSVMLKIFGLTIPVVEPNDLIKYKSMLIGHQLQDIKAVQNYRINNKNLRPPG